MKIGAGLAAAFVGMALTLSGNDGSADTQPPAAEATIIALYSWFPAVLFVLVFVIIVSSGRFDRLILPQVHADLDARGPAAQGSAQGSEIELEATPHVMVGDPAGVDPNPSRDLLSVERSVRDDS